MPTNTFYPSTREEWWTWLEEHFESENEIWFVFPSKASGEAGVSYNDAVEEDDHGCVGVYASHVYERSHIDGVFATIKTLNGYLGV